MRRFSLDALAPTPWRNGGGLTREIAAGNVDGHDGTGWDWRLSVASIRADGPFSVFDGVDRVATLVDGHLELTSARRTLRWSRPGDTHAFAGDDAFDCKVAPEGARLLNVMAARARLLPCVAVHEDDATLDGSQTVAGCWLVLEGCFEIVSQQGRLVLEAGEGCVVDGAPPAAQARRRSAQSRLAEVRFLHRDHP
ncbi:MAG: HutD family protein [Pseudacidovorax sp.]|nr:HutD family protein [Pseudacidovorax sp.]